MFDAKIALNQITKEIHQIFRQQGENAVKVAKANTPMDTGLLQSSIHVVTGIDSKKNVYMKLISNLEYAEYQHENELNHLLDLGKRKGLSQIGKTLHSINPRKRKNVIKRSSAYNIGYRFAIREGLMKRERTDYLQRGMDFIYPKILQMIKLFAIKL